MAPEGWTLKVEIPPSMNRSAPFLSADQLLIWLRNRLPSFQKAGTEYRGACPIHKGGDANFTINPDKGVGYCHSKCQRGFSVVQIEAQITGASIREAIREIRRITGAPVPNGHGGLIELEAYDYVDEQGQLLFQQVRLFDGAQGKKTFRSRRPGPDGRWLSGLAGVRRVLYRLPAVLKAATVFIVEGEKDVHTIERWGLTATTNPLGAGKWEDSYSESLHGKDVVISIDNDGPGLRHGEAVAARLAGKAKSVVVVTMPRPYKDISDWQQSGATKADFLAAIELTRAEENKTARESSKPPIYDGHQYCFWNRGIWGFRQTASGHVPFEITNFEAVVVQDRLLDDGSGEEARVFSIRATVNRNEIEVESTAKEFCTMSWVSEKLGAMAIVYPNRTEHLRAAIQTLSEDIRTVRVYSHTGWRRIDGHEHYLHAGGAIGSRGIRTDIRVSLENTLPNYVLPAPPEGEELVGAVRSSLACLDVASDRITFPVIASAYRAALGAATFSIHIVGASGQGKSQLAALAQQHFGAPMDADHPPAAWGDTALAILTLAFFAKDAVLLVDDFVLKGNAAEQQKLHSEADRVFRGQGNQSGRRRLTAEGRLQTNRPPRGLIISTGEHSPRGKSLNARLILLPFPRNAMNWQRLTQAQITAARGDLARAMAAFVRWLAPQIDVVRKRLADSTFEKRKDAKEDVPHMRTAENLRSARFGFDVFLAFARGCNAITDSEHKAYMDRADVAFEEVAENELQKHTVNDPARIFLRYISAALQMGRAHLISPSGGPPDHEWHWGWVRRTDERVGQRTAQGNMIGWLKGTEVCLNPDAAFQIASKLASERGESLPGTLETIQRDLKEGGFIRVDKKRRTFTVRRQFQGKTEYVLCFDVGTFESGSFGDADDADNADNSDQIVPTKGEILDE